MRKHRLNAKYSGENIAARENKELNRPARAISFGGSAVSAASSFIENTGSFNKFVNKTIDMVYENEAAYNAIYSLIIAGILKPIAVMNMPGSDEKDKQIVATKNFLQAFIGSFLGLTVGGGFVKKAIDVVKNNLNFIEKINENNKIDPLKANSTNALEIAKSVIIKEHNGIKDKVKAAANSFGQEQGFKKIGAFMSGLFKEIKYDPSIDEILAKSEKLINNFEKNHIGILERNPEFLRQIKEHKADLKSGTTYAEAFDSLWKNSTGALTAVGKAKISSILLPGVMAFLFAKKNLESAAKEQSKQNTMSNNKTFKAKEEEYQRMLKKSNLSFTGSALDAGIEGLAKGIEYLGMSKPGAALARLLAKSKKPSARMSDAESFIITGYWLQNTARSKKIEPSQKWGLNVHSALVTVVSSTAAFIIDTVLDGVIDKAKTGYSKKLNSIVVSVKDQQNGKLWSHTDAAIEMAVKKACNNILGKNLEEGSEALSNAINEAVESLNQSNYIKNTEIVDKNFVNSAYEAMQNSRPLTKAIKEQCGEMINAKKVAQTLSTIDLKDDGKVKEAIKDLTNNYGKKLSKFKSLTIFTLVVRFLVPVLMVPFSGKLKKVILEKVEKSKAEKAEKKA